jgi:hypothetical protein
MRYIGIALFLGLLGVPLSAQDVRDKVAPWAAEAKPPNLLSPDSSIFGVSYGTTEDEFIARFGKPTAYIRIRPHESGTVYGRSHCFLFTDGKLSGVRITPHMIFDWAIGNWIADVTPFDAVKWKLDNGISQETRRSEVERILGERLVKDGTRWYYTTDNTTVDLDFVHRVYEDGKQSDPWFVAGVTIRLK